MSTVSSVPILHLQNLSAGDAITVEAYRGIRLSIIPVGGTVRYSLVDKMGATAHDSGTQVDITESTTIDVAWPFYHVSVTSGTARLALV